MPGGAGSQDNITSVNLYTCVGKKMPTYSTWYGCKMLTNEHYRHFIRMNNRKKSHKVEDYMRNGYKILKLPTDHQPLNYKLIDWLNQNCGEYGWTSDRWSLLAFASADQCTLFQLTWGGQVLELNGYTNKYCKKLRS